MSLARLQTRTRSSSAFTLVELMIVIAIVGILASLVAVGVMKSLEKAKAVAARLEISQIEAAVAAAKTKYGIDNLPQAIVLYDNLIDWQKESGNGQFGPSANKYPTELSSFSLNQKKQIVSDSLNLMKKLFGNNFLSDTASFNPMTNSWTPTGVTVKWSSSTKPINPIIYPVYLGSDKALWFLLGGVLDKNDTFLGFPGAPADPTNSSKPATKPILPFLEMDKSKIKVDPNGNGFANYLDSYGTPYVYFSSKNSYCDLPVSSYPNQPITSIGTFTYEGKVVRPFIQTLGTKIPDTKFYNPRTFQLISAGPDKIFGTNSSSAFIAGSGDYAIGKDGYDDLSNFSSTPLGKKDE